MKIISLNTWHSQLREPLRAYIELHRESTDVFCFQEASDEDRQAYADLLEGFELEPVRRLENDGSTYSNATYVRKGLTILETGHLFIARSESEFELGIAGYVTVQLHEHEVTICNVHGIPLPGHKLDSPARLHQSQALLKTFAEKENTVIIGDFNLLPESESVQVFTRHGYMDLIAQYGIESTRNQITYDRFPDDIQYYADYAFVSPTITVMNFTVPDQIVSDHQPLELIIDIPA